MGRKGVAKKRLDKYYHLAKERGYRSRAAFKLVQLNKKYDFLSGARGVLDLCAAPGSWLQVAREYMPVSGVLVGVDLVPIKAIPRTVTLTADITTDKCRAALKKQFKDVRVDVVLHDGAPNVGQAWLKDAYGQAELTLASLKLGAEFLSPGGWFVTKVFRSADYHSLLWAFNQVFAKVEATKPQASRNESAEIFVVCQKFTGAKIDPRLFDPKCVFSDLTQVKQANALQAKPGAKAPALGYAESDYLLYHPDSVVSFVRSETPVKVLSEKSALTWERADPACAFYLDQVATTPEVRKLCQDLRVLGKGDLRTLLKWRLKMRAAWRDRTEAERTAAGAPAVEEAPAAVPEDEDEAAVREIEELAAAANARAKSAARRAKRLLTKQKERLALKMDLPGDRPDVQEDMELFSLGRIKSQGGLDAVLGSQGGDIVLDDADRDDVDFLESSVTAAEHGGVGGGSAGATGAAGGDIDGDGFDAEADADAEYARRLDEELDDMYEQYKARTLSKAAQQRSLAAKYKHAVPTRAASRSAAEEDDEDKETVDARAARLGDRNPLLRDAPGDDSDEEPDDEALDSWFDQPLLRGVASEPGGGMRRRVGKGGEGAGGREGPRAGASAEAAGEEGEEGEEGDEGGEEVEATGGEQERLDADLAEEDYETPPDETPPDETPPDETPPRGGPGGPAAVVGRPADVGGAGDDGARARRRAAAAARALGTGSVEVASESEDEDEADVAFRHQGSAHAARQARLAREAERIALGQVVIRKRKREELEDAAYNRNTFADKDLPAWFSDDEARVRRTGMALADEASVAAAADALKAVDARTIGKVAEAKARKKRRSTKLVEKLKKQADSIVGKDDMSEREKAQAIDKLYAKKLKKKRPSAKIVVTSRGGRSGVAKAKSDISKGAGTGRIKRVDKRMLADKRGEKNAAARKAGKGRKASSSGKRKGSSRPGRFKRH